MMPKTKNIQWATVLWATERGQRIIARKEGDSNNGMHKIISEHSLNLEVDVLQQQKTNKSKK